LPGLAIELRASIRLRVGLTALHLLAIGSVWLCEPSVFVALLLSGGITISLIRSLGWRTDRIRRLEQRDGRWFLIADDGMIRERPLSCWFVHPRLLVLVFGRVWPGHDALVLPGDAARADDLRRLRRSLLDRQRMDELDDELPGA
jgi:hypothetical protein